MTENATHYAAVRACATALRLWRKGETEKVNGTLTHMPVATMVGAFLTLAEGGYAGLASLTGKDFDTMVEAVCAELIGLESETDG